MPCIWVLKSFPLVQHHPWMTISSAPNTSKKGQLQTWPPLLPLSFFLFFLQPFLSFTCKELKGQSQSYVYFIGWFRIAFFSSTLAIVSFQTQITEDGRVLTYPPPPPRLSWTRWCKHIIELIKKRKIRKKDTTANRKSNFNGHRLWDVCP